MSVDREALGVQHERIRASLGSLAETVRRAQFAAAQLEHTGNFNEAMHDLRGALEDDQSLERLREWEASS